MLGHVKVPYVGLFQVLNDFYGLFLVESKPCDCVNVFHLKSRLSFNDTVNSVDCIKTALACFFVFN